jgi:hypothetical protein
METTPVGEILCEMAGVSSTTSSNQQDTIQQCQSWSSMVEHFDYQDLVFREGARVKNRVTPLIDTNKTSHPLDEQQQQQYKSIHSVTSIQRVYLLYCFVQR